ncbi:MAG TPA: DUF2339 domain-containing protein, partial [Candidatus Polarisedimenticolaceae bacterium]|nr:DUF2339 domain-containing protein [Candidatus Polarisedimenticolaceae bacterium]
SRVLLNARFATFAVATFAFASAFLLARSRRPALRAAERSVFAVVGAAVNVLAVWALSLEVWDFFALVELGVDRSLARQMGLSILWALSATTLIVSGVRRRSAGLRWQGLALLAVAICKVFVFDLSFLERVYRVLSFLALGLLLLIVSFLYQRRPAGPGSGS